MSTMFVCNGQSKETMQVIIAISGTFFKSRDVWSIDVYSDVLKKFMNWIEYSA